MEYRESNASGYDARYSRLRYTESVGEKYEDGSDNEFFAAEDMSYMEYDEDMDDSGTNELVKAVVSSEDDTSLPVLTFRFWFIANVFAIALTVVNTVYFLRSEPLAFSVIFVLLISYPVGKLLERILPTTRFSILGWKFSLNPGPFNIKEHSAITIYCGLTLGVTDLMIFMLQKDVFYQPKWPLGVTMLLLGSTIVVGFSIQGILGGYLTRSPDMLFPILLVAISLIRSLNEKNSFGTGGINGTKFVMIVGGVSALYQMIPSLVFRCLSYFSPLCYIFPNNQVAHQLGSGLSGLGMLSASFDWSTIVSFFGSPMVIPLWSAANSLVGFVLVAWIVTPILYYANYLNFARLPINSSNIYDMYGSVYSTSQVLDSNNMLDVEKYLAYSPIKLNVSVFLAYCSSLAAFSSVIVHFMLYYTKDLTQYLKNSIIENRKSASGFSDIHNKLMSFYKKVPLWWNICLLILSIGTAILTTIIWDVGVKWYIYLFSLSVSLLLFFPTGIVYGVSNLRMDISILLQIVVGYLDPGNPVGNLGARTIGNCILDQSINAAENFKMGHYMKIPPRELWIMQIVGTVVSMFVTIFTLRVVEHNVEDLCMSTSQNWSCTKLRSIITATHIWGLIGPSELFSFGREYSHIWISLGIGSILPVFSYILTKKYPGTWISYIHVPIIFISARMFPPATSASLITAICICFVFNYWVYRYKHAWWTRYNYLLSSGLEFGIVVGGVISVMISSFSPFTPPNWWGNDQLVNCPLSVRPYIVPKPPGS